MVNVFGDSIENGSGNFQMVKKVVVTKDKFKDYSDEIRKSYELGFPPYRIHTNVEGVFLLPFVFIVGGHLYWTMLPQWRLVIVRLQRMK